MPPIATLILSTLSIVAALFAVFNERRYCRKTPHVIQKNNEADFRIEQGPGFWAGALLPSESKSHPI
jgi:hypothetical protein